MLTGRCTDDNEVGSNWQIIEVERFITRDDYDAYSHDNDIAILE